MKILFVGVLDVPWSTNIAMMRELEKKGHHVTAFNYRTLMKKYAEAADNFMNKWEKIYKVLNKPLQSQYLQDLYYRSIGRYQMNRDLMNEVKCGSYDLVLMAKADTVDPHTIKDMSKYAKTWYFFMDWLPTAHSCDAIEKAEVSDFASATHSDVYEQFYRVNGSSIFLTQGVDKGLFRPLSVEKDIDVCFVGSATKERVGLIDYLRSRRINVTHYGPATENGAIYMEDLVRLYCRSRIVLNLNQSSIGFSIRVFQVLGTGAFLLSEYCPDLARLFNKKEELDWFHTKEECAELITYYLDHPSDREFIAGTGLSRVQNNYSWEKIIGKMLDAIQEESIKGTHLSTYHCNSMKPFHPFQTDQDPVSI